MKILHGAIAFALACTACGKKAEEAPPAAAAGTAAPTAAAPTESERAQVAAAKVQEVVKDPQAATAKIGEAVRAGDPTALATGKTGGGKLDCDVVVPAAMREKYMKGATVEAGSMVSRSLMCSGKRGEGLAYQITYDCRPTSTLAQFKQRGAKSGKPAIAGLGRAAFGDETNVEFYDDDADCVVTAATYTEGEKVADLARELGQALKPELLPPVEKGKYTLDCEKVLPADLREKFLKGAELERDSIMADQMTCKFTTPDFKTTNVTYTCGGKFTGDFLAQTKEQMGKQKMKVEDIAIGQGALYSSMMGSHTVTTVDAETGCLLSVMTMSGDKAGAVALAKAIEAALTVESAK